MAILEALVVLEIAVHQRGPLGAWREARRLFRRPDVRGRSLRLALASWWVTVGLLAFSTVAFELSLALHLPVVFWALPLLVGVPIGVFVSLVWAHSWFEATAHRSKKRAVFSSKPLSPVWTFVQIAGLSIVSYMIFHPHTGVGWQPMLMRRAPVYSSEAICLGALRRAWPTISGARASCLPKSGFQMGW